VLPRCQFVTEKLGGQVQVVFSPLPSSLDLIKAGKLRALAVTAVTRQKGLPGIPAVAEFLWAFVDLFRRAGGPMLKRPSSTRSGSIRCRRTSAAGWSQYAQEMQDADNLGSHK
jgi:hypothetical protein